MNYKELDKLQIIHKKFEKINIMRDMMRFEQSDEAALKLLGLSEATSLTFDTEATIAVVGFAEVYYAAKKRLDSLEPVPLTPAVRDEAKSVTATYMTELDQLNAQLSPRDPQQYASPYTRRVGVDAAGKIIERRRDEIEERLRAVSPATAPLGGDRQVAVLPPKEFALLHAIRDGIELIGAKPSEETLTAMELDELNREAAELAKVHTLPGRSGRRRVVARAV